MNKSVTIRLAIALAAFAMAAAHTGLAAVNSTSLLLQKSPADGGQISFGEGVHRFDTGSDVTLTAVANPGYQFVYWLGDVTDPTANTTAIMLDSPKIVIAVFEKATYNYYETAERAQLSRGGGSGVFYSAVDYSNTRISPAGNGRRTSFKWPTPPIEDQDEPEFPVPDDSLQPGEIPVPGEIDQPVPEPATLLLFGCGAVLVRIAGVKTGYTKH